MCLARLRQHVRRPEPALRRGTPARLRGVGLAVLAAGLAALGVACGSDTEAARPTGAIVDTTTVLTQDVPTIVRAVGTVEAENQTVVKSEVAGQVSRIVADEGSRVRKGDLVLQIDPTPFQLAYDEGVAAVEQARAALENDERLLARYDELIKGGAIDQQSYEDVAARVKGERAALQSARARMEQARWDVGKAGVRAPFDGWVGERRIELGSYVESGDDLFDLVDPTPVRVAFDISEANVGVLKEGDPVSFTVRTDPGRDYEGTVIYVSPSLDPATRTQRARAEYPNERGEVKPGGFADVEVTASVRADAPVIPEEALVSEGEQSFVYVIEDAQARKREIQPGERLDGRLEVREGLKGGELVVVAGQRELRDGMPVRYAERPAAAPGEVGPGREEAR